MRSPGSFEIWKFVGVRRFNYGNLNSIILVFCSGWRSRTAVPRISILNFITNSSTKTCQDGWTNFEDRIKLGTRPRARFIPTPKVITRWNRYRYYYLVLWFSIERDTISFKDGSRTWWQFSQLPRTKYPDYKWKCAHFVLRALILKCVFYIHLGCR